MNYNTQPTCDLLSDSVPELDLDLIRLDLEILAKETVDKTLAQAKAARTDPVLGSSSTLATYFMMFPRNDGLQSKLSWTKIRAFLMKGWRSSPISNAHR